MSLLEEGGLADLLLVSFPAAPPPSKVAPAAAPAADLSICNMVLQAGTSHSSSPFFPPPPLRRAAKGLWEGFFLGAGGARGDGEEGKGEEDDMAC